MNFWKNNANNEVGVNVPKIYIAQLAVNFDNVHKVIPNGYKFATLEELSLNYLKKPRFKENLERFICAGLMVNKKGLHSKGPHKINPDGSFTEVTESEYDKLTTFERSWHRPGKGAVCVSSGIDDNYLYVSASQESYQGFGYVAYVKIKTDPLKFEDVLNDYLRRKGI